MTNAEKARELCKLYQANRASLFQHLLAMAEWKDEQFKQLLIEKTKLLSPSAAQDSVKRCTIEEIYRELFNEEMPNSNPYMK